MKYLSNWVSKIKKILFGYTTPYCVGVDISSSAIKMLQLAVNSLHIQKYKINSISKNLVTDGIINDIEKISEIIRNQWDTLEPDYKETAIAVPYNAIVLREINAPLFKQKFELDKYVRTQLSRELDNEDIDFDYMIKAKTDQEQTLSVVVSKKEKIEEYLAIIQMTGMKVAAIDVEPFAIQYLFESILLNRVREKRNIVVLELGSTRIRAFAFIEKKLVIFNELSVNYIPYIEDIFLEFNESLPSDTTLLNEQVYKYLENNPISAAELAKVIVNDVIKILQVVKSSMLVEKNIRLSESARAYLIGGNALIPGVLENISKIFTTPAVYGSTLLENENKHIPRVDLMRLFTALALATWGHKIDKN